MPVPLIHATEPSVDSVIVSQSAFPSIMARRRSIMTAEVSVHFPLLCMRKTLSSFMVSASALAGIIVSTSASTSSMLSIRFFILSSREFAENIL